MGEVIRYTNGTTGGPVFVDVQDGKILRIVPLYFDDTDAPSWTINARGRSFTPPRKTTSSPWTVAHRSTVYSPKRILTPLKRVDFDPKGARNIHNRGISGYEPIGWDEAFDIVGDDLGILIGRHGKTLDALQTVVAAVTNRKSELRYPILVDVSGYRYRRKAKLEEIARRAADRVARQGRPVKLRPMSSYERKVVHMTLRDDRRVVTASEGEEPFRQVVVGPK
jgi:anaerobic selenocysteine-containing dehydrogenase